MSIESVDHGLDLSPETAQRVLDGVFGQVEMKDAFAKRMMIEWDCRLKCMNATFFEGSDLVEINYQVVRQDVDGIFRPLLNNTFVGWNSDFYSAGFAASTLGTHTLLVNLSSSKYQEFSV